jgi:hypothetical protein
VATPPHLRRLPTPRAMSNPDIGAITISIFIALGLITLAVLIWLILRK